MVTSYIVKLLQTVTNAVGPDYFFRLEVIPLYCGYLY